MAIAVSEDIRDAAHGTPWRLIVFGLVSSTWGSWGTWITYTRLF